MAVKNFQHFIEILSQRENARAAWEKRLYDHACALPEKCRAAWDAPEEWPPSGTTPAQPAVSIRALDSAVDCHIFPRNDATFHDDYLPFNLNVVIKTNRGFHPISIALAVRTNPHLKYNFYITEHKTTGIKWYDHDEIIAAISDRVIEELTK